MHSEMEQLQAQLVGSRVTQQSRTLYMIRCCTATLPSWEVPCCLLLGAGCWVMSAVCCWVLSAVGCCLQLGDFCCWVISAAGCCLLLGAGCCWVLPAALGPLGREIVQ